MTARTIIVSALACALLHIGCSEQEASLGLDGAVPPDSSVAQDAGKQDGNVPPALDAGPQDANGPPPVDAADASTGAPTVDSGLAEGCFRPFSVPDDLARGTPGCACEETASAVFGHCVPVPQPQSPSGVTYHAIACIAQRWASVLDGPCGPAGPVSLEHCAAKGGSAFVATGDAGTADGGPTAIGRCPLGYERLDRLEGGECCKPLVARQAACVAAGFQALADPGDGSLLAAGCPDGRRLRAHISGEDFDEGGLCCER